MSIAKDAANLLVCPYCHNELQFTKKKLSCFLCKTDYPISSSGQIDFRLKREKQIDSPFLLTPEFKPEENIFKYERHFDKNIPRKANGEMLLDLGCGNAEISQKFTDQGFRYIGFRLLRKESANFGRCTRAAF